MTSKSISFLKLNKEESFVDENPCPHTSKVRGYADRIFSPQVLNFMKGHVQDCGPCHKNFRDYQQTLAQIRDLIPEGDFSNTVRGDIQSDLDEVLTAFFKQKKLNERQRKKDTSVVGPIQIARDILTALVSYTMFKYSLIALILGISLKVIFTNH